VVGGAEAECSETFSTLTRDLGYRRGVQRTHALRAEHVASVSLDAPHDAPGAVVLFHATGRAERHERVAAWQVLNASANLRDNSGKRGEEVMLSALSPFRGA
jgi:hypothetical protein